jgi:hypothetical protein
MTCDSQADLFFGIKSHADSPMNSEFPQDFLVEEKKTLEQHHNDCKFFSSLTRNPKFL